MLPVEAHAARLAPIARAWVKAADIPLSLKLPDGFIPSYWRNSRPGWRPTYFATPSAACRRVCPSPMVTHWWAREREQFAEPPHATEAKGIGSISRFRLEARQRARQRHAIPIVRHV